MCTCINCYSLSRFSNFFCSIFNNSNKKKDDKKIIMQNLNNVNKDIIMKNKPSIKILMIGDEKDSELIKEKEYIQEYFFDKTYFKKDNAQFLIILM